MRALRQFEKFDYMAFARDKDFCVTGVEPWLDFETKKPLGHKVMTVITRDGTVYATKDGRVISNLFQTQIFKCAERPNVNVGDVIVPDGDITCTVYGQFREGLSIRCTTVKVVTPTAGKEKN